MATYSTLEISNLGSSDERIAARRQRAEAKLKQDKEEAEGKKTKDDTFEQVSLGKEQYGKSIAELERFRTETWDELTSILVRFDDQERETFSGQHHG